MTGPIEHVSHRRASGFRRSRTSLRRRRSPAMNGSVSISARPHHPPRCLSPRAAATIHPLMSSLSIDDIAYTPVACGLGSDLTQISFPPRPRATCGSDKSAPATTTGAATNPGRPLTGSSLLITARLASRRSSTSPTHDARADDIVLRRRVVAATSSPVSGDRRLDHGNCIPTSSLAKGRADWCAKPRARHWRRVHTPECGKAVVA